MTRIKVDLDGALPRDIGDRVEWVLGTMRLRAEAISYYKTRRGYHLEIRVTRKLHPWRVIALQAILGSDYRRETFNLRRTGQWAKLTPVARQKWNVLFTKKYQLKGATQ